MTSAFLLKVAEYALCVPITYLQGPDAQAEAKELRPVEESPE